MLVASPGGLANASLFSSRNAPASRNAPHASARGLGRPALFAANPSGAISAPRRRNMRVLAIASDKAPKGPKPAEAKGEGSAASKPTKPISSPRSHLFTVDDLNNATAQFSHSQAIKSAGVLSGGVENATDRSVLPPPVIAVRNLMEQARFATMCSTMSDMHHRRSGYPFGSLVDFATDSDGCPIFSLSPLAVHTRNIMADPRCTMNVTMPGWTGLANARVTLFGDVYLLPEEQQEAARELFRLKHETLKHTNQYGNFNFYRMHVIKDIYFVGGFGTVTWINVREYIENMPDAVVMNGPNATLERLNEGYSKTLTQVLMHDEHEVDDACFISIDARGVDVRIRRGAEFKIERIRFPDPVTNCVEAEAAVRAITDRARS